VNASSQDPKRAEPAWTQRDLAENPHAVADKARRVRQMFAAIARSYDLNNRVHSMGRDQAWRRAAVKLCDVKSADVVLDVACGTGDLSLAFAAAQPAPRRVVGVDFTHEMVQVATHKHDHQRVRTATSFAPCDFTDGDAMRLPVADDSVDIVSIAFGIRNVADPALAVREFARVMRPGGRLCILEFSLPTNSLMRSAYMFYFKRIMPHTAALIARDRSGAYKYLPQSVNTFLSRQQMIDMMSAAGFVNITARPLTFGIAVAYVGHLV
jgi:demethylmenaquinone methyltransferase/2-methoxy-6-polyprenyl-1,4-benzoquinol methylase